LKRNGKMKAKMQHKIGHFRNSDSMVRFFKNDHFSANFVLIFTFIF
jgi:hypothetical protein